MTTAGAWYLVRQTSPDSTGVDTANCQPRARKHRVCDHCGGRFGMVTHSWWGNKFCKKSCKAAYLREVLLGRDTFRRRFGLTGPSPHEWSPLRAVSKRANSMRSPA
jgi:hypothetical protein